MFVPTRNQKISHKDYAIWRLDFFEKDVKNLRFGQAFVNRFYPEVGEGVADIFYSNQNNAILEQEIYNRFVKFD